MEETSLSHATCTPTLRHWQAAALAVLASLGVSCGSAPTCDTSTTCLEEARLLAPPGEQRTDSNAGRDSLWAANLYGQACDLGSREGCEQHIRYWQAVRSRGGIPSTNTATGNFTVQSHEDIPPGRAEAELARTWPILTRLAYEELVQNSPNDAAAHEAYLQTFQGAEQTAQVRQRLAVIRGEEYAASGQLDALFQLARSGSSGANEAEPRLYELLRSSDNVEAIITFCQMFGQSRGEPVETHLRELFDRWLTLVTLQAASEIPASRGMLNVWSMQDAHPHWNSNLPALVEAVRELALRVEDTADRLASWRTFFANHENAFPRFTRDFEAAIASALPSMRLNEMITIPSQPYLRGRDGENIRSTISQAATTRARSEIDAAWRTVRAANSIDQTRDFISRWERIGRQLETELQPLRQARQLLARQEQQADAAAAAEQRRADAQAAAEERRDAELERRCERIYDDLSEGESNCNIDYTCGYQCDAEQHCQRLRQRPNAFDRCTSRYGEPQYDACYRRCEQTQRSRNRFCAQLARATRAAEALGCN